MVDVEALQLLAVPQNRAAVVPKLRRGRYRIEDASIGVVEDEGAVALSLGSEAALMEGDMVG